QIFDVVTARTSASVSISEREQKGVQISLLYPVFPNGLHRLRRRVIGIAGGQKRGNAAAVHAFPCEVMVWELLALIVGPENFLGHQILHAALLQNLRQYGGI